MLHVPSSPTTVLASVLKESEAHPTTKAGSIEQVDEILSEIGLLRFSNLHDRSEEKLVARLEAILASGLPAGALAREPSSHSWPLHHAVEVGSVKAATLLLEFGSPVDAPGESTGGGGAAADRTPLGAAVYEAAQPQMVELLLHHGANPFVQRPPPPSPRSAVPSPLASSFPASSAAGDDEPPSGARRRLCVQMLERAQAAPYPAGQKCTCLHHNWGHDPGRPTRKRRRAQLDRSSSYSYCVVEVKATGVEGLAVEAEATAPSSSGEPSSCLRGCQADRCEADRCLCTVGALTPPPPPLAPPASALGRRPLRDCIEYARTSGGPLSGAMRALGGRPEYRPSPLGPGWRPRH